MAKKLTLDQILNQLEDATGDTDLIDNLRDAIDEQADNPDLVRNLRGQINELRQDRDTLRLEKQSDVLRAAGVPEKAHKRFLRDWADEKVTDEFTVENVTAKADEFGYALTAPGASTETPGGETPPAGGGGDDDLQRRREAQERARAARATGGVDDVVPPDLDTQIEEARKAGDTERVFALNRQKMDKATG